MARYIDANKIDFSSIKDASNRIIAKLIISNQPTADVEEVRHGEWIEHFSYGCWHYDCPFCDDGYAAKEKDKTPPNYCGYCGAKMDGGKAE